MNHGGVGVSFLEQVKSVILTDKELIELRGRFETALAQKISDWVLEDWKKIQLCILDSAEKREFSIVEGGMCITGEFFTGGTWRRVEGSPLRELCSELKKRGLSWQYFDVEYSELYGFSMRLCFRRASLDENTPSHTYRVCTQMGSSYVTQLMELARRNGVMLFCHDAPVCLSAPLPKINEGADGALRFSYAVTV